MHTLVCPDSNTEDTVVLFRVSGANVNFTDDGQFHSILDAALIAPHGPSCGRAERGNRHLHQRRRRRLHLRGGMMRAVVMKDATLRVQDVLEPVPGSGEVLVDVLACGICGTDLHCAAHAPEFNAATKGAAGIELMDLDARWCSDMSSSAASWPTDPTPNSGSRSAAGWCRCRFCPRAAGDARPPAPAARAAAASGWCSRAAAHRGSDHVSTEVAALTEPSPWRTGR